MNIKNKKTILLVEDEVIIALSAKRVLEDHGYRVITARTGEEAIDLATGSQETDLVLMDINLGEGIDGTDAAVRILEVCDLPIVFLSSHTERDVVEKIENITSYGYIVKNSGNTVLVASIKMAFKLYESNRISSRRNKRVEDTMRRLRTLNEEYRKANGRLKWWDTLMRSVIQHDMTGIAVLDDQMRYMYVSEQFEHDFFADGMDLSGKDLIGRDLIGKSHSDLFPFDSERWLTLNRRALAGEELRSEEDSFQLPDGTVEYVRWECRPWYTDDTGIGGIILYTEIITERKNAENELRRREELLTTTEQLAHAAGWEWDVEHEAMYSTAGIQQFYDPGNTISDSDERIEAWLTAFDTEDRTTIMDGFRRCASDGTSFILECPFYASDDPDQWVRVSMSGMKEDGQSRKVVGSFLDISELKGVKEELQAFLENSPLLIAEFTPHGRYTRVNTSFARGMNLSPQEVVGKSFSDFLSPEKVREFSERVGIVVETREPTTVEDELEFDGQTAYYETTLFPLFGHAGNIRAIGGMARDITESKLARRRIAEQEKQLFRAQRLEAIGRTTGEVAHDFNNNMTGIRGYLQIAGDTIDDNNPAKKAVESGLLLAKRASGMTRKLLYFSKGMPGDSEVFDVNGTVRSVLGLLAPLVSKMVRIVPDITDNELPVYGDEGRMEQVITNIVLNARDAVTDNGEITIRTWMQAGNQCANLADPQKPRAPMGNPTYAVFSIIDNGIGMDAATQERLFEPFFTTKGEDLGTGLGLSAAYGIVTEMGGHIDVDSTPGVGTTFTVYLPYRVPDDSMGNAG